MGIKKRSMDVCNRSIVSNAPTPRSFSLVLLYFF